MRIICEKISGNSFTVYYLDTEFQLNIKNFITSFGKSYQPEMFPSLSI